MKEFLFRSDCQNWAVILMFLLCYMHAVMGEKLETIRREKWDEIYHE